MVIGCQGVGKNIVANAVLGRNVFKFWTKFNRRSVNKTYTVSGRQIHLCRVPGWRGELRQSNDITRKMVQCVHSSKPHAVLLVVNFKQALTKSTIETLESNLSSQLWAHTIVVFTNTRRKGLDDIIPFTGHEQLTDKCGQKIIIIVSVI